MVFQIWFVGVSIVVEVMTLDNKLQNAFHIAVKNSHRQPSILRIGKQFVILFVLSWLQHVVTCHH